MLKIFKEGVEGKDVYLRLVRDREFIVLVVCNREGEKLINLLDIDSKTLEIYRYGFVDPKLGFELNKKEEVVIN